MTRRRGGKRPIRSNGENGRYAHITGWGAEVPERVLTNHDIEKMVDTSDEWIRERTGISERRIADDRDTTVTLGIRAARKALKRANILPDDLDLIIVATGSSEHLFPSTACLIQDQLGATRAGAFDLLAACSGFIYALGMAAGQIKSGQAQTVLIVGTEIFSRITDWNDRGTCILFADGAGAFVLQVSDTPGGVREVVLHSDGSGGDLLSVPSGVRATWNGSEPPPKSVIYMNGRDVFRFAARVMTSAIEEVIRNTGLMLSDIDVIIPHQANLRIIDASMRSLKFPSERVIINVERYGNTSAASIPIALVEAVEQGRIKANDRLVVVGFGGGLTWGAALLEWDVIPTTASYGRDVLREGLYILARVRSLLNRMMRFLESVFVRGPSKSHWRLLKRSENSPPHSEPKK
ncbi:MAG: ketoacyl-ACP synthase III [Anaerolineae bacterium]|nr:ketoacyl-ACP synthase III [Anaerolineae bacterium]